MTASMVGESETVGDSVGDTEKEGCRLYKDKSDEEKGNWNYLLSVFIW